MHVRLDDAGLGEQEPLSLGLAKCVRLGRITPSLAESHSISSRSASAKRRRSRTTGSISTVGAVGSPPPRKSSTTVKPSRRSSAMRAGVTARDHASKSRERPRIRPVNSSMDTIAAVASSRALGTLTNSTRSEFWLVPLRARHFQ